MRRKQKPKPCWKEERLRHTFEESQNKSQLVARSAAFLDPQPGELDRELRPHSGVVQDELDVGGQGAALCQLADALQEKGRHGGAMHALLLGLGQRLLRGRLHLAALGGEVRRDGHAWQGGKEGEEWDA